MKYWNIGQILPFQRCFNFIDGPRSIGKTYGTLKFLVRKARDTGQEFSYIVRTQDEKKKGVFEKAFEKVLNQEFPDDHFLFERDIMYYVHYDEEIPENATEKELKALPKTLYTLGYCHALSEAVKLKKYSFPKVKYMVFDEYMLEPAQAKSYVNGWHEPDLLLSIYHTIDRDQDKVICFLLGNNTNFYNPYHLHPAFNIPLVEKGSIWTSDNVLFQNADITQELQEEKARSKFQQMVRESQYGRYATEGIYTDQDSTFIEKRTRKAKHIFSMKHNETIFGIWLDSDSGILYIDNKFDPSNGIIFAMTIQDQTENTFIDKKSFYIRYLARSFMSGNVRFTSPTVRALADPAIRMII